MPNVLLPSSSTFEALFRYAFQRDFGKTPEEVFGITDKSSWHFNMSLNKMLVEFDAHIREQGTEKNLDARAIAGAIAWEYEQNLKGRYSDYLPAALNNGIGWGSMHTSVAQKLRPHATTDDLYRLRMNARSAVILVAEHMNNLANLYFDLTTTVTVPYKPEGIWLRDNPELLATFYNSSETFLKSSASKQVNNPQRQNGSVDLVVKQNAMGSWVKNNLSRFKKFATSPVLPTDFNVVTANSV